MKQMDPDRKRECEKWESIEWKHFDGNCMLLAVACEFLPVTTLESSFTCLYP